MTAPEKATQAAPLAAEALACHLARLASDSKLQDVIVLDLRGFSSITDFFVIASGSSERQIRSVSEEFIDLAAILGVSKPRIQGGDSARWIVSDFVDVMVHLFEASLRPYYDLESLWADVKNVKWHEKTRPGEFTEALAARKGGRV